MNLVAISRALCQQVQRLRFALPVTHTYNPLDYAWAPHRAYLSRYGRRPQRVILLGMNPGPFGMAQTGVPFGEVTMVRDWLRLEAAVKRPADEHPKRPVLGFSCPRTEVSGARLWGWARDRFGTPGRFFRRFFVANYCPLVFMEASARNRTPDRLPAAERDRLFACCDEALRRTVQALGAVRVIGVGRFAERRAKSALGDAGVQVGGILHPSPASPKANRGWSAVVEQQLREQGIDL